MALPEVIIIKGTGGLGRTEAGMDATCGMMCSGVATTQLALNTTVLLLSVKDAEAKGLTAAYDNTNSVLVYHHITEFFRMNPNGKLWIRLCAQATTLTQMADITLTHAKQLLLDAMGEVQVLAISRNPITTYTATNSGGLDGDVIAAVPKAQALADAEFIDHRPVQIVIEGRGYNGTAAAATNLRATSPAARNVSVVIGQDMDISILKPIYNKYAAIGTLLGSISRARVSENVGWVQPFNLNSPANNRFIKASLSSGLNITSYTTTDLNALNDKGFIFVRKFVGYPGFYWNDDHTCVLVSDDYYSISNNRTINKAVREVYSALVPRLNSPVKVNAAGQLDKIDIASFESTCRRPLDLMQGNNECSNYSVYIDPNQNITVTSKLQVNIRIQPIGVARFIEVTIGLAATI